MILQYLTRLAHADTRFRGLGGDLRGGAALRVGHGLEPDPRRPPQGRLYDVDMCYDITLYYRSCYDIA